MWVSLETVVVVAAAERIHNGPESIFQPPARFYGSTGPSEWGLCRALPDLLPNSFSTRDTKCVLGHREQEEWCSLQKQGHGARGNEVVREASHTSIGGFIAVMSP